MSKKVMVVGALIVAVGIGIFFTGRRNNTAPLTNTNAPQEQTGNAEVQTAQSGCSAGFSKTVVGLTYTVVGSETHTIKGQTYDLCCWATGEGTRKKKICSDRTTSPVGYDNGVVFENDDKSGQYIKTMETYREGNTICQQYYESDGTPGSLNCRNRLN